MEESLDDYIKAKKNNLDKIVLESKGIVDKTALLKDNTSPYLKNLVSGLSAAQKKTVAAPNLREENMAVNRNRDSDRFDDLFDRDLIAKKRKIIEENASGSEYVQSGYTQKPQTVELTISDKMVELYIEKKIVELLENKPQILEKYIIQVLKKYVKSQKK